MRLTLVMIVSVSLFVLVASKDDDIEYDQTVFNPNLPLEASPDFDDFEPSETHHATVTTPTGGASSHLIGQLPTGIEKLTRDNPLLANLTTEEQAKFVGDAFKRFVQTTRDLKQDTKSDDNDRLSSLKNYLSHLKKEEHSKFNFPPSVPNDWVPLISTKSLKAQLAHQQPQRHSRLQESSAADVASSTIKTVATENSEPEKISQIYENDVPEEAIHRKNQPNFYSKDPNFKKYLTCCDNLFNKYGTVDERIYEDMYISPARYKFPVASSPSSPSIPFSYSYPLRQPPAATYVATYPPVQVPRMYSNDIRTTVQTYPPMTTFPSMSAASQASSSPSSECYADPNHFYHSHRSAPQIAHSFPRPYQSPGIQHRSWFARKKNSMFGRNKFSYFG